MKLKTLEYQQQQQYQQKFERKRIFYSGIVQGVGFRPFVYKTAKKFNLTGYVFNNYNGVIVEIEGISDNIHSFLLAIKQKLPPIASIAFLSQKSIPIKNTKYFIILNSSQRKGNNAKLNIPPDLSICPSCISELLNYKNRRFYYPFINCTNCGPRFSIIADIPYDRMNTSMSKFDLCVKCSNEYKNPQNRRFHAEPNACSNCGPLLKLLNANGLPINLTSNSTIINTVCNFLLKGKIIAIKGIGGFHLAVNAKNTQAIQILRQRKYREEKPLALMVKNLKEITNLVSFNKKEIELLLSPSRPIVLLQKKNKADLLLPQVAPNIPNIGIMLAYSPLHVLILNKIPIIIMTSGNQSNEPICIKNDEAVKRLNGIADYFLINNREILRRCDDSVMKYELNSSIMIRRSRGFVPKPIFLQEKYPEVLALGSQLKVTICLLRDNQALISQHIGDLETSQAQDFFVETCNFFKKITKSNPKLIACDLHPDYFSSRYARSLGKQIIKVQHHHAHIVSCMAEYNLKGSVIGLVMDGTGLGNDGNSWGGEFLTTDILSFKRVGHFKNFFLIGGYKAIIEPWRLALSLLKETFNDNWYPIAMKMNIIPQKISINNLKKIIDKKNLYPMTSSLGRIFDGVSSLLIKRQFSSFEGQAAMELENLVITNKNFCNLEKIKLEFLIKNLKLLNNKIMLQIDFVPVIKNIVKYLLKGISNIVIANEFHQAVIIALVKSSLLIREKTALNKIILTGGCFQNSLLLKGCKEKLQKLGFEVFFNNSIPLNDGSISLGQALVAGSLKKQNLI